MTGGAPRYEHGRSARMGHVTDDTAAGLELFIALSIWGVVVGLKIAYMLIVLVGY